MRTLILATRNSHKTMEIRAILRQPFRFCSINDFPRLPENVEDAGTFAGNATKKAVTLATWLAERPDLREANDAGEAFALADDSGLEVDALGGAPGVHSARFAALDHGGETNSPTAENNRKLLHLLKDVHREKRTARFRCVLALTPLVLGAAGPETNSPVCYADARELGTELFEGTCEGLIELTPRGKGGFGYDPLFVPVGYEQTFGELPEEVKNALSHRARALERLKAYFENIHARAKDPA